MKKQKKLMIQMALFFLFIIVAFGLIILDELGNPILKKKTEERIDEYIEEKFDSKYQIQDMTYNRKTKQYEKRVHHPKNSNLFFTVSYKNKKIKTTYQRDFIEGKTLFQYYQKKYNKDLQVNNYPNMEIIFLKKLNQYNRSLQEEIIIQQDVKHLPIYFIQLEKEIPNLEENTIVQSLLDLNEYITKKKYEPAYYTIELINKSNVVESLMIQKIEKKYFRQKDLTYLVKQMLLENQSIKDTFDIEYELKN